MLRKAWEYIQLNNMIEKGDRIVVGVSGGADSVCLLYVLREVCTVLSVSLAVVHVNHGIRGEEADRDERYVKGICSNMGIDFYTYSYDVRKYARELGISEEEAGRKLRYEAFLKTCKATGSNKIAVAHNKNDNAETVLFHLFRGTGVRGLSGIEAKRPLLADFGEVTLIRPLLGMERREIEEYLSLQKISYQTDSTNLGDDYSRNKIRNKVLTYAVKEINAGAVGNICETACQLKEIQEYITYQVEMRYQALVKQENKTLKVSVEELRLEPVVLERGIVYHMLEQLSGNRKDLEAKHVEAVLSLLHRQVGRQVSLPYRLIAEREYTVISIYRASSNVEEQTSQMQPAAVEAAIPGTTIIPWKDKIIKTELIDYKKSEPIPKSSCAKWFDYDKIENAVEIRTRKEGDYIQINKFGGNKKLKDYFIDKKVPQKLRDSQLLVTDGSHVMWIVDSSDRISEKYKVDENTKKVLLMKMFDLEEKEDGR